MQRKFFNIISLLSIYAVIAVVMSACVTGSGQKQQMGTILGAGIGGLAGSHVGGGEGRLVAVAAGTLAGALLGSEMGNSMDKTDQLYAQRAQQQAHSAPLGETISWSNPDSGNGGQVIAAREGYAQESGRLCREYNHTIYVGGDTETAYGTACREEDGSWTLVN
jgi:surface antigen